MHRRLVRAAWGALLAHVGLACTPRPVAPTAPVACELVARNVAEADYPALYERHGLLVLQGDAAWACPCGPRPLQAEQRALGGDTQDRSLGGDAQDRSLGGDTQDRSLGGDAQDRSLGGDTQDRSLGGDAQDRSLGGDTQDRSLGGDTQTRALGSDVQARSLGGDTQAPTCRGTPSCSGFVLAGFRSVTYYDGAGVRTLDGACVP